MNKKVELIGSDSEHAKDKGMSAAGAIDPELTDHKDDNGERTGPDVDTVKVPVESTGAEVEPAETDRDNKESESDGKLTDRARNGTISTDEAKSLTERIDVHTNNV